MKKFRFSFEQVLSLRKRREDEALRDLATAQKRHLDQLNLKKFYLNELDRSANRKMQLAEGDVRLSEIILEQKYIEGTKQRVLASDQAIFRANRVVDKTSGVYFAAKKQRKILDRLKEKQFANFKEQKNKHDAKVQEDLNVMRFHLREEEIE